MRWPRVWLLGLGFLSALGGCRNCDLVEAELRTKDTQVRELHEELDRAQSYNDALQRELHDVRQSCSSKLTPEKASQIYTLKELVLGRGTGGYDDDNCPGDEALQVVLEPRDPDDQAIKAPGSVHVVAMEISPEGLKTPFSSWDIPADQVRRNWQSGLFSTGYRLVLPWKTWPTTPKLRVLVQFTLADGRVFEADKDVTVHLPQGPHPGPGPAADSLSPPPQETAPIPPPRKEEDSGPILGVQSPPTVSARKSDITQSTSLRPASAPLSGAIRILQPLPVK